MNVSELYKSTFQSNTHWHNTLEIEAFNKRMNIDNYDFKAGLKNAATQL